MQDGLAYDADEFVQNLNLVSSSDLSACLTQNSGRSITQEAWTNFVTYFDQTCGDLYIYDYDPTELLDCNEDILVDIGISVAECQSWYTDVEDWFYDIYAVPELDQLISLVPELAQIFGGEFGQEIYDIYTYLLEFNVWDSEFPECTYLNDLQLEGALYEEFSQFCFNQTGARRRLQE